MQYFLRRPFDQPQHRHTPQDVYCHRREHRREFLKFLGRSTLLSPLAFGLAGCSKPTDQEIFDAGTVDLEDELETNIYPAARNSKYEYGRPKTPRRAAAEFTNFYEFTSQKDVWRHMPDFHPEEDWRVQVDGACAKPMSFTMDDLHAAFRRHFEERAYRHRCVEAWAMCIPWTGIALSELLKKVEPKPSAKFVAFETFGPRADAGNMTDVSYPWPYRETLSIEEAMNELTFLATGLYGEPLPKQHGTPIRLVVPWKYGFKSIKSLIRMTLTEHPAGSFWNDVWPEAYDLAANVNPDKRHPSWSQRTEWMLGTGDRYPTVLYNGYGEYVGGLYPS